MKTRSFLILAALCLLMSWMTSSAIWLGDDVDYGFVIHDHVWTSSGEITSAGDIISSQVAHYHNTNGRFVAHTLVQLFCGVLGKGAFTLCNALVYFAFAWLAVRLGGVRHPLRHPLATATAAAIIPLAFLTKMMPSCQIGFVWMFTLSMAWLNLFIHRPRAGLLSSAGIALLGIVAGNGQEALSIGLSAALGIWWLRRGCCIGLRRSIWLFCYWAGTLSVCLAPGTLSRSGRLDIALPDSLMYLLLSLRVVYILIAVMLWLHFRQKESMRQIWRKAALWLNTAVILLLFNLWVGVYSNRQLFGVELAAMIAVIRLLSGHSLNRVWLIIIAAASLFTCVHQIGCARKVSRQFRDIATLYLASPDGTVFYDRTLGSVNPFDREYRIYEDITGYGAHETRRTLVKAFARRYPDRPPLRLYPMAINRLSAPIDTAIEYEPQHYMVLVTGDKPEKFRIEGHNAIFPWIKYSEESVAAGYPAIGGLGWYATIVAPWRPFATIDTIYVKR
ncbi:MAG: hypothetical protein K2I56_06335 [Muribaculaceae bacterium]|nr:hypothetical protein [Muribaculaceae bacterium]